MQTRFRSNGSVKIETQPHDENLCGQTSGFSQRHQRQH